MQPEDPVLGGDGEPDLKQPGGDDRAGEEAPARPPAEEHEGGEEESDPREREESDPEGFPRHEADAGGRWRPAEGPEHLSGLAPGFGARWREGSEEHSGERDELEEPEEGNPGDRHDGEPGRAEPQADAGREGHDRGEEERAHRDLRGSGGTGLDAAPGEGCGEDVDEKQTQGGAALPGSGEGVREECPLVGEESRHRGRGMIIGDLERLH